MHIHSLLLSLMSSLLLLEARLDISIKIGIHDSLVMDRIEHSTSATGAAVGSYFFGPPFSLPFANSCRNSTFAFWICRLSFGLAFAHSPSLILRTLQSNKPLIQSWYVCRRCSRQSLEPAALYVVNACPCTTSWSTSSYWMSTPTWKG